MNKALILASGTGSRMGSNIPKQFIEVNNKPLLIYTLEAFQKNDKIDEIVVTTNQDYIDIVLSWCEKYNLSKVKHVVNGSTTRQKSVYCGLCKLKETGTNLDDLILIHDAARVLVSQSIIDKNIESTLKYDATNTAIPSIDTIIRLDEKNDVYETLPRNELYNVQTPQTFKFELILKAHEQALRNNEDNSLDDASLVIKYGSKVHIVEGSKYNFKVTTKEDLDYLKFILSKK